MVSQSLEFLFVASVAEKALVPHQHLMASAFQTDVVIVGHAVIAADAKPLGEQQLREMEADKTGCSGDKDATHEGLCHQGLCHLEAIRNE